MDKEDTINYAMQLGLSPLSMQATNRRLRQIRKRLNACCKGLLEVQFYEDATDPTESSLSSSVFFNWKVDFLHRTAKNFLLTENRWTDGLLRGLNRRSTFVVLFWPMSNALHRKKTAFIKTNHCKSFAAYS